MGKVFTWPEVRDGLVPKSAHFGIVTEKLRTGLVNEDSVDASVIIGSVVRGDHNLRSDIDCLVVYHADKERSAFAVMQQLSLVAAKWYVPVTFIACGTDVAATRMHHLGPSFFEHVARSAHAGGVIKGWPVTVLMQDNRSKALELESYVRVKLYSLGEQWAEYPSKNADQKAHFLKKALEAPVHVARKTLARASELKGDSKAQIQKQYESEMSTDLAESLGKLLALDREYTGVLGEQLEHPNEADYSDFLGCIEDQVPSILSFVKSNALYLATLPAP